MTTAHRTIPADDAYEFHALVLESQVARNAAQVAAAEARRLETEAGRLEAAARAILAGHGLDPATCRLVTKRGAPYPVGTVLHADNTPMPAPEAEAPAPTLELVPPAAAG